MTHVMTVTAAMDVYGQLVSNPRLSKPTQYHIRLKYSCVTPEFTGVFCSWRKLGLITSLCMFEPHCD